MYSRPRGVLYFGYQFGQNRNVLLQKRPFFCFYPATSCTALQSSVTKG